ncbi:hypothetical protein FPV67DRAFT_1542306 [Lyophyllum atratum]|nr:hypothetical protein FPV67DRAFT_1542306 [Lyophyllum atratum]
MFAHDERMQIRGIALAMLKNIAAITTSTLLYDSTENLRLRNIRTTPLPLRIRRPARSPAIFPTQRRVKCPARTILPSTTLLSFLLSTLNWSTTTLAGSAISTWTSITGPLEIPSIQRRVVILDETSNWTVPSLVRLLRRLSGQTPGDAHG